MSRKHLLFVQSLYSAPSSHKPMITPQVIEQQVGTWLDFFAKKKWWNKSHGIKGKNESKNNLHNIKGASIWIPVSVDDNSIIAFVYEMCASTYVIHIRWASIPVMKLYKTSTPRPHFMSPKLISVMYSLITCLGCATNHTWHEWCWAKRLTLVRIWLTYSVSVLLSCQKKRKRTHINTNP